MRTSQSFWAEGRWLAAPGGDPALAGAQLVLVFGGRQVLKEGSALAALRSAHPDAILLGCSTAGEIRGTVVSEDSLVATAVRFDATRVRIVTATMRGARASQEVGRGLAAELAGPELAHVFVLSCGLDVNGSELVRGLTAALPSGVTVTGGLAGDGERFEETHVLGGDAAGPDVIAALGLYGSAIRVGYGSHGGWECFGPQRVITRSEGNVLYEVDGQPALALYKRYLGEHAESLPASGLLFPLSVELPGSKIPVVRTILAVDEAKGSMTFAGDVPVGASARLMIASIDSLVDGAAGAAVTSAGALARTTAELAVLISCVGRKLVLKQRVEEEVEAVRDLVGPAAAVTGFYSYGEIAPFAPLARCELHNQTMTVTLFSEA